MIAGAVFGLIFNTCILNVVDAISKMGLFVVAIVCLIKTIGRRKQA